MSELPARPKRRPYQITDDATWALVRRAYLGGLSARDCAERFDVSVHAIKRRITREGWGKRAFANAVAAVAPPAPFLPIDPATPEPAFVVQRRGGLPPMPVEVEAAPLASAPASPADMADEAFARAADAFAAGRTDEAQRLLKLAGEAQKMARTAGPDRGAARGAAGPDVYIPELKDDDVIIGLEQLFDMVEHWAGQMIVGELGNMPAFLVHLAAHWRRANLTGPYLYFHDMESLRQTSLAWFDEVAEEDGRLKPLPTLDEAARYVWGRRDFPALAQVPPKLRALRAGASGIRPQKRF